MVTGNGGNQPLVSIGVPVRNAEKYVARALDSLLAQTYPNLEILISDNASTDGTYETCQRYASDPRVKLSRNEQNVGASKNFGLTLERANGKYFMWAAADDVWSPPFVAALVGELEAHPEAGVAMTATRRVLEGGGEYDVVRYGRADDPSRMSWLRLTLAGADLKSSYYLYIYGLYRAGYLRQAFAGLPEFAGSDRLFLIQLAMSTGLRYVDEVWNVRQIAAKPLEVRNADDPGRVWNNPFIPWLYFLLVGPFLLRSPVVPRWRKLLIPVVVLRLMTPRQLYQGFYMVVNHYLHRALGPRRHAAVRRLFGRRAGPPI